VIGEWNCPRSGKPLPHAIADYREIDRAALLI
jgi:hypothetical protein